MTANQASRIFDLVFNRALVPTTNITRTLSRTVKGWMTEMMIAVDRSTSLVADDKSSGLPPSKAKNSHPDGRMSDVALEFIPEPLFITVDYFSSACVTV